MKIIKCACNGEECEGICRKKHLYRERKELDICPAAFEDKKQ